MWERGELKNKLLHQIISFSGNGRLRDDGQCSEEFRNYLTCVPFAQIRRYAEECINSGFTDSGKALQDIVNEVGRRFEFNVENGRYQGVRNQIGHDGLWTLHDGKKIVVEVKTTDVYAINLHKIARYRRELIKREELDEEMASILLIVGRQDSGALEMQIRGSRYASDMRVIGVDALLKIAEVKDKVDEATFNKICPVLIPDEFTRLDAIAEMLLSVAVDSSDEEDGGQLQEETSGEPGAEITLPIAETFVLKASQKLKRNFVRRSRTNFSTPEKNSGAVCLVSKRHSGGYFWFSVREKQKKFLRNFKESWMMFCCKSDSDILFAIPWCDLEPMLGNLPRTVQGKTEYRHVHIIHRDSKWIIRTAGGNDNADISPYMLRESPGDATD